MGRWYENQPRLVNADFMHHLPAGARKVGVLLYQALDSGYRQYQTRQQQGLAQTAPAADTKP